MKNLKLKVEKREKTGKKSKELFKEKMLPAVIYDQETNSTPIKIQYGEMLALLKEATKTSILEVDLDGKKKYALIKEIQKDPVQGTLKHISLFEIKKGKKLHFEIPIVTEGIAPAVKNNIGILVTTIDAIPVKCTLEELVQEIRIDVTELEKPGDKIRLNEIDFPESLELLHKEDKDKTIITITNLQKLQVIEEDEEDEEDEEGEVLEGEEGEVLEGEETEEGGESTTPGEETNKPTE